MNPESRIKLIRSLEEIKLFEQTFYRTKTQSIVNWIFFFVYIILGVFVVGPDILKKPLIPLFMIVSTIAFSLWISFRNKLNERHKLLANAVLELGSIAQESPAPEPVPRKNRRKVTRPKMQAINRKKK